MNLPQTRQQTEAKEHLGGWRAGALFMKMGTGKTRVAVEIVNGTRLRPLDNPSTSSGRDGTGLAQTDNDAARTDKDNRTDMLVVWIGPYRTINPPEGVASVQDEIEKWGGFRAKEVVYMGIETLQSSDRQYLRLYRRISVAWSCFLIVDESLKIKNETAKRTKRLLELSKMAQYKLILNGTPLSKNLMDLWSQMEFLSPEILRMSSAEFKGTFCRTTTVTKYFGNSYKGYSKEFITGYENIDYLYSLIRHYVYEADLELNVSKVFRELNYTIEEELMDEYKRLKEKYLDNEMLLWKNNNIFLEMTQKMQHVYCCAEGKFEAVKEIMKEVPESECLIYCKYVASREECERRFKNAKVLSYQKESLGLNLQAYSVTIFFDKIWDYALREQSLHRTFRIGQETDCRYFDLTGNVGLERLIDENIRKKIDMLEYFKGKTKQELNVEL